MNVTKNIITDLLPLYYAEECSDDTKLLVEEYLQKNPELKQQAKNFSQHPLPNHIPLSLNKEDEMKSLVKTRRLLKWRSSVMALAIFFSIAPFSFCYVDGKFHSMIAESPTSALIYGGIGICSWIAYFIVKRRTNSL
jgi:hypothetical protein